MNDANAHKPGYKHTPLGWVPEEWEVGAVGKAFKICNNLRFPISEEDRKKIQGQYPYYGPTKVQDNINEFRIEGKYALIGEDGDHFLKWRELPMTLLVEGKFNVNNHAHVLQGTLENLTEWFFYYFNHKELTTYLTRQGAGRYKLTKDALSKIPILLPPLHEQNKIATILSTWDTAIAKTQEIIRQLQLRNRGLMQELLTGKRRLKESYPDWRDVRLGEVFQERNETNTQGTLLSITADRGVIYQSESDKKDTSNEDKSKYRRICIGDIGYNTMRMWQGRSALSNLEGIVSPAYTIVRANEDQYSPFYALLFKLPAVIHKFYRNSQGLVDDTLNCKFKDFALVNVTIPEYEEQLKIAEVISKAIEEQKQYERLLVTLQTQKKGLMQKLLTGAIRVNLNQETS